MSLLTNGCLQQIAANRFSTPQDVIAILLQGFVIRVFSFDHQITIRWNIRPDLASK